MRTLAALFLALSPAAALAAPGPAAPLAAAIAPSQTDIYIGHVSLALGPMERRGGACAWHYTARVHPFVFFDESGELSIAPLDLGRLAAGQPIQFTGKAVRSDGLVRSVEGRAVPSGPRTGKVKVRVRVSHDTELIFNTTYQLVRAGP